MEEAVRCVWKEADSIREGDSFSGNGTRILQAALWAQFSSHFLSSTIRDIFSKIWSFTLSGCHKNTDSTYKYGNRLFPPWELWIFLFGGFHVLPLVLWPGASATWVLYACVCWFPNKSRNHPAPHKFQCYQPIIPAAPQSSTDKHLARYFGAVFFCLLWKLKLLAWRVFLIYSIS